MRRRFFRFVVTFLLAIPVCAQPPVGPASDSEQIAKLLGEIASAFVSRDSSPLERIYSEGYVGIRGRPVYNAFEQMLAMVKADAAALKAGKKLDFETLSFESEDPVIRTAGDAAIVTAVKKNLWRYKDARCLNRYQSTDVFARIGGTWKLVLGHMSLIPCDPMPWQPIHPAVAGMRNQTKPVKNISPSEESELRHLVAVAGDESSDVFDAGYVSTSIVNAVGSDKEVLRTALRTPTSRSNERYRDDEAYLCFGSVGVYIFRIRSLSTGTEGRPEPPITYSVIFAKNKNGWKIIASHASTLFD